MADEEIRSASDCFHAQNQLRVSRALRPQRQWEYQQLVLFAQFRRKRVRSLEEDVDLAGLAHRETRGQLLYRPRYDGQYLPAQSAVHRANRKFRRRESHPFAQNRPGICATAPEARAASLSRV